MSRVIVLVFSDGVTLADWQSGGTLDREWALYERLIAEGETVIFATGGDAKDEAIGAELDAGLIVATGSSDADIAASVVGAIKSAPQVVVKTNQMCAGDRALAIVRALRDAGHAPALLARGGYLYSRFIANIHGSGSPEAIAAGGREGRLVRAADLVVGTTEVMLDDLAWRHGLDPESSTLIPNYVITDRDPTPCNERDQQLILTAGQLIERKRIDLIIEAVAQLGSRRTLNLVVVGTGPLESELRELAKARSVNVEFKRRVAHTELFDLMHRCAVYVHASSLEGHPKTVLEAMAAAAPIVATHAPGTSDVLCHGVSGLLFEGAADAISQGIEGILDDPSWGETLGFSASRTVRATCSLDVIVPLERAAYNAAIQRSPSPRKASTEVSWEPSLLDADVQSAVAAWQRSLHGFAKRLAPDARARFLAALDTPFYIMQGEAAIEASGGLHPKHRLTGYHDFFVSNITSGERVADLGCGVGALASSIAHRSGAHVVGMDWSPANLTKAQTSPADTLSFVAGDITRDRLEGTFDTIVLSNVLEHVVERPTLLRQWVSWYGARKVLIRVPAFDREWRVPWKQELGVEWRLDDDHKTEFTPEQLESELHEAGLSIEQMQRRWGEFWVVARAA